MQAIERTFSKLETTFPSNVGYIYAIAGNFLNVLANLSAQKVAKNSSPLQSLYIGGIQVFIYSYASVASTGQSPYTKDRKIAKILVIRSLTSVIAGFFLCFGLAWAPLGDDTVLMMIGPVITGLLAFFMLNEKYNLTLFITSCFGLIGVILILKPTAIFGGTVKEYLIYPDRGLGFMCILSFTAIVSFNQILVKKIGTAVKDSALALYTGLGLAFGTSVAQLLIGVNPVNFEAMHYILLLGCLRYYVQILTNKSYLYAPAAKIAILTYFQVPIAYVIDLIVGNDPDIYSTLGAVSVFSSVFILMYKQYSQSRAASPPSLPK